MLKPHTTCDDDAALAASDMVRILDVENGLDRIMGDRILYLKILRRFLHDHGTTPCQIRVEFDAGNYASARLKAHTLKGAAGMIGAHHVHSLSATLESALRAQAPDLARQMLQLELAQDQLLGAVSSMLGTPEASHTAAQDVAPDPAAPAIQLLLARLASHLREGDGAAIDILENSASLLAASLGVQAYQEVASAAYEFNFDGALAALLRRR
ncbi:Hpt domain-containing protein [Janthinobacterium lividum]|uniref:Sensor/response regulator hybrid protein n=1 Tax=Janthinobacterium lividum TaxID=29581 RepID=A0A1E8PSC4_9BURK|nr:sensor/response regulator hybrid protein [Janthinobacterium lividum]